MSRYNQHSGSGTGSNNGDYDDTTLKLQKYAALNLTGNRVKLYDGDQYGDKFIVGFDDVAVIDGIVMQRDDKPDTWKVFGFGDMGFNVGEDGLVYAGYDAENDEYTDELSAEMVLNHARVEGLSEKFGDTTYFYTPVGVVIEEGQDVALNDDLDVEQTEVGSTSDERDTTVGIEVGEVSMLLSNKSWVRTLAKLMTSHGDDIIATEENEDGETVAVTESYGWFTADETDIREGLEGREMELFVIEETQTFGDEEVTYTTPILLDVKTGERITIDNDATDLEASDDGSKDEDAAEDEAEAQPAVADGGATTEAGNSTATSETSSPTSPDEAPSPESDSSTDDEPEGADDGNVPDVLDDLIGYFARTQGEVEPDELREFAEDEVDDPDAVDWNEAASLVEERAD